ncbi:2OG-Fe(II) oxygenase [Rhodococcoides trifolii]|uniref:2OG-Fe(II) oxygenase n=1 Tax=Rhodococcoides trifolii TaxID=908250 RepID=A0A917G548_9NOCA|nr:isopenicillin N synthase family oxygenase [Rhodococcus trifolii]GGG22248.1 2OG-Fe(II) oxygenase [Rhodococcus trifolii]
MTFHVPTVDISPYVVDGGSPDARRPVAEDIDFACSTVGFIQIVGHGVPDDVIAGLANAMDSFFGMSPEDKRAFITPPSINRGYSAPKSESLSLSLGVESADRMNDFFEAFNVGAQASDYPSVELPEADYPSNIWPSDEFRAGVEAYYAHASRVARTLTRIFADALGVGSFDDLTDHSVDAFRMNNYALPPGEVHLEGELTGMGAHTDYGIVTVLWADQVAGLQVLGTDQVWHDVSPADGALLVNLGDLTARLTNDRWMSTLHRVKPPIVDGTIQRRRSAAFFHDGNIDAVIAPLPSHGSPLYEPVTVADHIRAKLAGSRGGTINTAAEREAARVAAALE